MARKGMRRRDETQGVTHQELDGLVVVRAVIQQDLEHPVSLTSSASHPQSMAVVPRSPQHLQGERRGREQL